MAALPKPEVILTHESDLDGLLSGLLLRRLARKLFNADVRLEAHHYTSWKQRQLRERAAAPQCRRHEVDEGEVHGLDALACDRLERIDRHEVARIAHRYDEPLTIHLNRKQPVLHAEFRGDECECVGGGWAFAQIPCIDFLLGGQHIDELGFTKDPKLDQAFTERLLELALVRQRLIQFLLADQTLGKQHFPKFTPHHHGYWQIGGASLRLQRFSQRIGCAP